MHTAHGKHAVVACLAAGKGPGTGQVDAVQPVGASACLGRFEQRLELAVRPQAGQGAADGGSVEVTDQQSLYRATVFQVLDHFLYQQLAFAVRVARVHHAGGLLDQFANHRQLATCLGARGQLPLPGHDGQPVQPPLFVGRVVGFRWGLLQQVAQAPGHDGIAAYNRAILALAAGQGIGNGPRQAGFLGDNQAHGV